MPFGDASVCVELGCINMFMFVLLKIHNLSDIQSFRLDLLRHLIISKMSQDNNNNDDSNTEDEIKAVSLRVMS